MNEALTTWALVVGIDKYDSPALPELSGATADAAEFVGWLRRLGVPDAQILLHAAPTDSNRKLLQDLSKPYDAATEAVIFASINRLRGETGTRLFIFLSGHGLYDPATRRVFLTQEAGVNGVWVNLGIDKYIELFLSMPYRRQFLILDGCQNYGWPEDRRSPIGANIYGNLSGFNAQPENTLVALFGASQDQRAAEIGGRGAFSKHLLATIDLDTPGLDAVDFDFSSGARSIDIRKAMDLVIPTVQTDAQALSPPLLQVPQVGVYGRGQSERTLPICRLADIETSQFHLDVQPPEAVTDVRLVQVAIDADPYWARVLKPPPQVAVPVVSVLPKGEKVIAECRVREDAPWDAVSGRYEFRAETDNTQTFYLQPRTPAGAPSGPIDGISVKIRGAQGQPIPAMPSVDGYREAGQKLGLGVTPDQGDEVAKGVVITPHEDGPDFDVAAGAADPEHVASAWAIAIKDIVPSELTIATTIRGSAPLTREPNLELRFPEGGAHRLAGVLVDEPAVYIVSAGEANDEPQQPVSLRALEKEPAVVVDAGHVRVRIVLPWGSWSGSAQVPQRGKAWLQLPDAIGTPPLRVQLYKEVNRYGSYILGTEGNRPSGRLRQSILSDASTDLVDGDPQSAAWALVAPETANQSSFRIAALSGSRTLTFPLPNRPVAIDRSSGGLRVEPLSPMPVAEWDLLVATGRLDALNVDQAIELTRQKWVDDLLGLAGAYAIFAAQSWRHLDEVLGNLYGLGHRSLDLDLLRVAQHPKEGQMLSNDALNRLHSWAEEGAVPWFRWGVPLLLDLLTKAPPDPHFIQWQEALQRLALGISPISAWTSWTERPD